MLTTIDESYDSAHRYLIFGALFNPNHKIIHRDFVECKKKLGYVRREDGKTREIKYALIGNRQNFEIAKQAVDCFIKSDSFFRGLVVDKSPNSGFNLDPARTGRDAGRIAEEVITHLIALTGAEVRVTLEIEANVPSGVPDNVVRTVTENSRTLKFTNQGFEKE
jgi:hypothetical protein